MTIINTSATNESGRPPIIYFIQCHAYEDHVYDLLSYLYNNTDHFIFYADLKSNSNLLALVDELAATYENVHSLPRDLVSWGGFSQVRATFDGLIYACNNIFDWSHIIIISGQHLPLCSPKQISEKLFHNTSYIFSYNYDSSNTQQSDDLLHRFSMYYCEVPGVGNFGLYQRPTDELLKTILHIGSNWMALSRPLCDTLVKSAAAASFLEYFSHSIQPDETAIPTIIIGAGMRPDLPVINRNLTFVADPGNGGSSNMIFSESQFFSAKKNGFLFIRKRPTILPNSIQLYLKSFSATPIIKFHCLNNVNNINYSNSFENDQIYNYIRESFEKRGETIDIRAVSPDIGLVPRLYIQFRAKNIHSRLFVAVVSENLIDFKVCLVLFDKFSGFSPKTIGGYYSSVMKVRVHDMAYNREIHVTDHAERGFIKVSDDRTLLQLTEIIGIYLGAAQRLSPTISIDT